MEISQKRSLSLNFDIPIVTTVATAFPSIYVHCESNIYPIQSMKTAQAFNIQQSSKSSLLLDMNTLNAKPMIPKKENFLYSMVGAITSIVTERFTRPGSFISNFNDTLSVTVVPNEGVIPPDFFKNLTRSSDQLASEKLNEKNEITKFQEILPNNSFYDVKSKISNMFPDEMKTLSGADNSDELKIEFVDEIKGEKISEYTQTPKDAKFLTNSTVDITMEDSCKTESKLIENGDNIVEDSTTGWHNMWRKVVKGVADHFETMRSDSSGGSSSRRSVTKPRRKTCTIALARGKGRGRSQLRRSGVSQSQHRKERPKPITCSDTQDDLESWDECYDESDDEEILEDSPESMENNRMMIDDSKEEEEQSSKACSMFYNIPFSQSPSKNTRKRKQTMGESPNVPVRVRYTPDKMMDIEFIDEDEVELSMKLPEFRRRQMSESSVDSEDSYCIVFEKESGSEDESEDEEDELDESSDEEDESSEDEDVEREETDKSQHKVRH